MFDLDESVMDAISARIDELSLLDFDRNGTMILHFNASGCDSCGGYCEYGCGAMCEVSNSD